MMQQPLWHKPFTLLLSALIAGCAGFTHPDGSAPLRAPKVQAGQDSSTLQRESGTEPGASTRFSEPPQPPVTAHNLIQPGADELPKFTPAQPMLTAALENLPLPAFINEVYGNLLGLSFQLDPQLQGATDLVTLRVTEAQNPAELYRLAAQVLQSYGVSVQREGELLRFSRGAALPGEVPLLVSGRTLPSVPVTHRPVFQLVPLHVVAADRMANWLHDVLGDQPKLQVKPDTLRGALFLTGPEALVRTALEMVKVLDQPTLRGRRSVRIEPVYWPAEELVKKLTEVLRAEGYNVSTDPDLGTVVLLPVKNNNSIVAFAADGASLEHIKDWAQELDLPQQASDRDGLFAYEARNTSARSLLDVLAGTASTRPDGAGAQTAAGAGMTTPASRGVGGIGTGASTLSTNTNSLGSAQGAAAASFGEGRLVLDESRNTLLFMGKTADWQQLLPTLRQLDRPERMVLVEVIIAEVTLSDKQQFGVEWFLGGSQAGAINNGILGERGAISLLQSASTNGASAIVPTANFVFDNAGQTKAILKALASDSRVRVLSNPQIMVRSGASANIDVGTQISTQSAAEDVTSGDIPRTRNQFTYVNTGVNLSVMPVVYSGNRVRLDVQQIVSSPGAKEQGEVNPPINNRRLNTSVSVRDGGSVLLGGLITTSTSNGERKVPLLGDVPLLGRLFRSTSDDQTRTELMMLVVPYVVEDDADSTELTEAFRRRLTPAADSDD